MKVCLFTGGMSAGGGGEKVMAMIANHLDNMGWSVNIVILLTSRCDREHHHLNAGINITDISPKSHSHYIFNIFHWVDKIKKTINKERPNLVISFFGRINALVLTALYYSKTPIIVSERSDPRLDRRGFFMRYYCNWIYKRATAIVYQTAYQQSCFSKRHLKRSHIIPNPITLLPLQQKHIIEPMLVTTAGSLRPCKNQLMLIKAMKKVLVEIPQAHCVIYGDGPMASILQQEIDNANLSNKVILGGKKSNVTDYISKCSVFVMTSNYEGLSNSLMEAMMLGKLCISTDYPGADELIEDGKTGYLVQRNDADALCRIIVKALRNSDGNGDVLRNNAHEKMLKYDSKNILNQWDKVINVIL